MSSLTSISLEIDGQFVTLTNVNAGQTGKEFKKNAKKQLKMMAKAIDKGHMSVSQTGQRIEEKSTLSSAYVADEDEIKVIGPTKKWSTGRCCTKEVGLALFLLFLVVGVVVAFLPTYFIHGCNQVVNWEGFVYCWVCMVSRQYSCLYPANTTHSNVTL